MNYNKLRYFYEVSCTLNLTRAAQNLYISQPALSKHIADLERDFGVPLFIRTNRNLLLTQAGEVLREDRVAAVLPAGHPLAGESRISLSQLKDDPFLFLDKAESSIPHDHAMRLCREAGFTPRVAAVYPNVETVVMMVQAGAGVSLLSSFAPLQGLTGVVCIPLTEAPAISLDLLWRSDSPNEASRVFVSFASEFPWQLDSTGGN